MPRYGFKTNLNRMFSSISASRKQKEREELINAQYGKKIKAGPFFSITGFEFNQKTRVAHITFKQEEKYRKIEKYVTVNYVRNPVYSDNWFKKEKLIKKTIKLTNKELEGLENNPDQLIKDFRFEIVESLHNEDLVPSWAVINSLNKDKDALLNEEKGKLTNALGEIGKKDTELKNKKDRLEADNKVTNLSLIKERKKSSNLKRKSSRRKNSILAIISFGVYGCLTSNKHKNKLSSKIKVSEGLISGYEKSIKDNKDQIVSIEKEINENVIKNGDVTRRYYANCKEIEKNYLNLISEVKPLDSDISDSNGFVPLKKLIGVEYQKIKGCYVIHNKEKDKYYVGQSKDVLKRVLRDHFTGTEVKNIIFAEDYYTSQYADKTDLFEVRIIKCDTKDELDDTERELIELYDSFKNGYNGTAGNS